MTPPDDIEPNDDDAPEAAAPGPVQERQFQMGDHKSERDRNKALKQRDARIDEAYRRLMESQDGRLLVWDMLTRCTVYSAGHHGEATHETSFELGKRNIGLQLFMRLMRLCPDQYATMQKENG